jgi:uncharacterized protein YhdP
MTTRLDDPATPAHRPRRRGGWIALAIVAVALVATAASFRWNWLRPAIRHYVASHSGRQLEIGDLQVHFRHGLDPTIEVRDVRIDNAPWAERRGQPFLRAGYVAATISWRSLGSGMTVIERMTLADADLDMERQADGTRNWRLVHPDDRGPPRVRVLALDARDSRLHLVHAGIGLVADAQTAPLPQARALAAHPELPLTRHLRFAGRAGGHPFEVDADVSDVLPFGDAGRLFALSGTARVGSMRLDAEGVSDDAHALGDFDIQARLAREGAGAPWPLPEGAARVRPLSAEGHFVKTGDRWHAGAARLQAGRGTAARGEVELVYAPRHRWVPGNAPLPPQPDPPPPPRVQATVEDAVLDLDDLGAWRGKADAASAPSAAPLSSAPLPWTRLRAVDATIDLRALRLVPARAPLAALVPRAAASAALAGGVLTVPRFELQLAGGRVDGSARVDGSSARARIDLDVRARGLVVAALSPRLARSGVDARIDARAALHAQGASAFALARAASGDVEAHLAPGASLPGRLDAKLSLDGGEWLRALFEKSARVPVDCAEIALTLSRGVATTRRFAVATGHAALAGRGSVDLADQRFDLVLLPVRKERALLALDKAIHARGPWRIPEVSLEAPPPGLAPQACGAAADAGPARVRTATTAAAAPPS